MAMCAFQKKKKKKKKKLRKKKKRRKQEKSVWVGGDVYSGRTPEFYVRS